jgi:hypothetical protein
MINAAFQEHAPIGATISFAPDRSRKWNAPERTSPAHPAAEQ